MNTSIVSGKSFLQLLGMFTEFETNIRKERALRKLNLKDLNIDSNEIKRGMEASEISQELGISIVSALFPSTSCTWISWLSRITERK